MITKPRTGGPMYRTFRAIFQAPNSAIECQYRLSWSSAICTRHMALVAEKADAGKRAP